MHKLLHILYACKLWILYPWAMRNSRFIEDLECWARWKSCPYKGRYMKFVYLMAEFREFRNLCYYRMGKLRYFLLWICSPESTLYIHCKDIGGGFLIQHGFATIITAEKIGKNCRVLQQVTIGIGKNGFPILGDNVTVYCGAKILGGVYVGNNARIGANAVVVKDVLQNNVVGGVPAKIIKVIDIDDKSIKN